MRRQTVLLLLLLTSYLLLDSSAQQMPLVYQVENTGADCPRPPLLLLDRLPITEAFPDPFAWADGRGRISNFSDWRYRRAEIGVQIQHYEIGLTIVDALGRIQAVLVDGEKPAGTYTVSWNASGFPSE